jgi:opacity protein-like surface antigen
MALALPTLAQAEGFYLNAQVGVSEQATDTQPIGNNIAVDSDFPAEFDSGDGTLTSVGIGYIINQQFRVEGRIANRDGSFNDTRFGTGARDGEEYILNGEIESTTYTIEGFYDFQNSTAFTPYVKAGIGLSDNSYSARLGGAGVAAFDQFDGTLDGYYDAYADDDGTELSWNIGFGANYELSNNIAIYAEYQYATFGDVISGQDSFTDGFEIDGIAASEVAIGISIKL